MADVCEKIIKRINLTINDIDWLAAHQANKRIIDATANRIDLPSNKVMMNIEKYGNTTSATIPLTALALEDDDLVTASMPEHLGFDRRPIDCGGADLPLLLTVSGEQNLIEHDRIAGRDVEGGDAEARAGLSPKLLAAGPKNRVHTRLLRGSWGSDLRFYSL